MCLPIDKGKRLMRHDAGPWGHFMDVSLFRWSRSDGKWVLLTGLLGAGGAWLGAWQHWITSADALLGFGLLIWTVSLDRMGLRFRGDTAMRSALLWLIGACAWAALMWTAFRLTGQTLF
jgi:hypothetical protein